MKSQQKLPQFKISQFDFIIIPKQILFSNYLNGVYLIQFDKGAQVLHKFEEEMKISDKQAKHKFKGGQICKFKLLNEKNSVCEWAIYQQSQGIRSEFIDSIPVNILSHYSKYVTNLKTFTADYARLLNSKNQNNSVSRQWALLKQNLNSIWRSASAFNKDGNMQIRFQLEIKCEIDYLAEAENNKTIQIIKKVSAVEDKQTLYERYLLPQQSKIQDNSNRELFNSVSYIDEEHKIVVNSPQVQSENYLQKSMSLLSDIIEASNQTSTNKNYGDKKVSLKQISGIPEELDQMSSPYVPISSTKTHNFDTADDSDVHTVKKRSNTLESSHSQHAQYSSNSLIQLRKVNDLSSLSQDQLLEKEQLIESQKLTNINSTINEEELTNLQEIPQQKPTSMSLNDQSLQKNKSHKFILILVVILSALAIFQLFSSTQNIRKRQNSKPVEIKSKKQKSSKSKSQVKQQRRK